MKSLTTYTNELTNFVGKLNVPTHESGVRYPKLSIITPSYNQANFLERTILSILNQGYPNLEYIVIDGGSTDHSVEVIRKYEKYITYWVSEKDSGQVDALNKGFDQATGDWVGFQNSDDVYFPDTFIRFGQAVAKSPELDLVYGDLFIIDQNDQVTELLKTVPFDIKSQLIEGMQIHNQSLFFKRELLEKCGSFDETFQFAFDYEFVTRFTMQNNTRVKRLNGLSGALRIHQDAKSSTIASLGRKEHRVVQETYMDSISLPLPKYIMFYYLRLKKLFYFLSQGEWNYLVHRNTIRRK